MIEGSGMISFNSFALSIFLFQVLTASRACSSVQQLSGFVIWLSNASRSLLPPGWYLIITNKRIFIGSSSLFVMASADRSLGSAFSNISAMTDLTFPYSFAFSSGSSVYVISNLPSGVDSRCLLYRLCTTSRVLCQ